MPPAPSSRADARPPSNTDEQPAGSHKTRTPYAEPRWGEALPERRAPWTQPVLPVPGGGGDLHVASLPGGEAHQAAEGVSDLLVP